MKTSTPTATLPDESAVKQLLIAGAALGTPHTLDRHQPYRLVPEGYTAEPIPVADLPPLPDHIRQQVRLEDADSFAAYVKRYQNTRTLIFARPATSGGDASFEAIFDYHHAAKGLEEERQAQRCAHRAVYPCPFSVEWKAWRAIDGKQQAQEPFLDFLDANAADIFHPTSADIHELALNFSAKTEVTFQSGLSRTVKGTTLTYQENVQAGGGKSGSIQVPDLIALRLPIFEGGAPFDVAARIAWDPRGGSLKISVHLQRVERVVRTALAHLRSEIKEATGLEPLTGAPTLL